MSKIALGLMVALAAAPSFAQSTSSGVGGLVTGTDGTPVAGAEVTIDFRGPGGVQDVLEFTIARDGAPTLEAGELAAWLEAELPTVGDGQP